MRGLKPVFDNNKLTNPTVAPRAGAWIETPSDFLIDIFSLVAPRAGAWIETSSNIDQVSQIIVAPRAGAWIETIYMGHIRSRKIVAPRAGAWIETTDAPWRINGIHGRTPRGCVD